MTCNRASVLYLTHRVPFPPDKGDRIRTFHVLKSLSDRFRVRLAFLADRAVAHGVDEGLRPLVEDLAAVRIGYSRWMRGACSLAAGRTITEGLFSSPRLRNIIGKWSDAQPFDAVVAACSSMVPYLDIEPLRRLPAVVDLIDADSEKFLDYARHARGVRRFLFGIEGRRLRTLEGRAVERAEAVAVVSRGEAGLVTRTAPRRAWQKIHTVPNGVDLEYFRCEPSPHTPSQSPPAAECVFTGALDYRANIDGLIWFCREVWPLVRLRHAAARFRIVGRDPTREVLALARHDGVEVVGTVPDVRPYLAQASVVVVPLRIARGIQNKVLEGFAMSKAVVATPAALEGLEAVHGRDVICADEPAAWADAIDRLLGEASLRDRLGASARAFVEQSHQWSPNLARFVDLVQTAIDRASTADGGCGPNASCEATAERRSLSQLPV